MKYRFYGNGSVWDKSRKTVLCQFSKPRIDLNRQGFIDTEDMYVINMLRTMGYKYESLKEVGVLKQEAPVKIEPLPTKTEQKLEIFQDKIVDEVIEAECNKVEVDIEPLPPLDEEEEDEIMQEVEQMKTEILGKHKRKTAKDKTR